MVKILFYTNTPYKFGTEITCMLAMSAANSYQFYSVYNKTKLRQLLQSEAGGAPIVILAAMTHEELDELLALRQLHNDLPVVLLLADESEATLQKAHKYHPKFLTTIHHDFRQVLSVVEQLSKSCIHHNKLQMVH